MSRWPRGRVLGGSSILNYMLYMRGHPGDYDAWGQLGLEGWSWREVLPAFIRSENWHGEVGTGRGKEGELSVEESRHQDGVTDALIKGAAELGYNVGDLNSALVDGGFTVSQVTTRKGHRAGAYRTFAEEHKGRGLTVMSHTTATRVVFQGKRAVGVEVERFGAVQEVLAAQEVILSAGAVGSPHLLLLSGVGDAAHLEEVGVDLVHNLPGVGSNLQDHLISPVSLEVEDGAALDLLTALSPSSLWQYLRHGAGPWASPGGCTGLALFHSENRSRLASPDLQLHIASLSLATDHGTVYRQNFNTEEVALQYISPHFGKATASIIATLNRPKSRGTIRLRDSSPHSHPVIDPQYLTHKDDIKR